MGDWQLQLNLQGKWPKTESITDEDILELVQTAAIAQYQSKLELGWARAVHALPTRQCCCKADTNWRDHLAALDYLRQGIHPARLCTKQPESGNTSAKR